ncbi:uncharacterized protein LOC115368750 isoform X2 [Myripristis murdjan]|uniref:uncharacterized protein LOC115368750 isoform X2 n=1 Tax=Myripristis murdjan TaxID=586833 RepID=UPI001175F0F8|nr:uncharacterized protein LOC115368750 isoform X2 [Myripristis murdjan]
MAERKERAAVFTQTEQQILVELYDEYKDIITKKGNTAAINKAREAAWAKIADRLNRYSSSGTRRTWQQVKIKHKNILQNVKKRALAVKSGGDYTPMDMTPSEELMLDSRGQPVVEDIKRNKSVALLDCSSDIRGGSVILIDSPPATQEANSDDEDVTEPPGAEEIISLCSERTELQQEPELATSHGHLPTSKTAGKHEVDNVQDVYKRFLLQKIEESKEEVAYKKLKMRKLELEIQKLERDATQE